MTVSLMLSSLAVCFLSWHTASSNIFERSGNSDYYSIDGSNNNLLFPEWGKKETKRVRLMPNASGYFDNSHIPADESNSQLPSARRIMEQVFSQSLPKADKGTNHLLLEFGHFIVQDTIGRTLTNDTDPFPMPCDGDVQDVLFCPVTGRSYSIAFSRSEHASGSSPRASMNSETAFLDMSHMYGNTNEAQAEVRSFEGGRVQLDEQGLPPILDKYNSSPGVFAVYCIFLRYHNILADAFAAEDPSLTDEEIFQMARRRNIAIYQFNAEEKYIPTLLGIKLEPYVAYDENVDPSIDEFFAAASFRYAHSSLSGLVRMLDENFDPITADPLILRDVFRQPSPNNVPRVIRNHGGIEVFLRGLSITNSKSVDSSFVRDLNYFTEATSLLDIQRGRDLGLPSYNDAREAFGLSRVTSFEELAGYDYEENTDALKNLYGDVDKVDAYVGALVEAHNLGEEIGPLFTMSIKNQFERLRDGDRFWYQNQYTQEEWENFPSLTELIKETCTGMDNFPSESFIAWDGVLDGALSTETCESSTQLSLINGAFSLGWLIEVPSAADTQVEPDLGSTIEVTLIANERMNAPGYLAVGWRSQVMKGAEIWWCTVNSDAYALETFPASCDEENKVDVQQKMFSCCVAPGKLHVQPVCSDENDAVHYELTVVDWCLTPVSSRVVVNAPVCDDDYDAESSDGKVNCFRTASNTNGEMDFIVAYNPNRIGNHGYQMRTAAAVDLSAGILTQSEAHVADTGLIATHAMFMLFGWCVLTPMAIFIVRYMKTRSWRLVAHVSLMGVVGSLMVPLLVGVEASVGATDKTQEHSAVGLFLLVVYFGMVFAGRIRFLKLRGRKVGRKTYFWSALLHKYGGLVIVFLAWWNCYTGLVRISPEDSFFQVFVLSSFPLGYDIPVFGVIRQYVFFPYLGFVCIIFVFAEARRYRMNGSSHAGKLKGILEGNESIWEENADQFLDKMTMESFLEATKLGSALCIVDGYVLDITTFMENHPGGQHLLRYAAGSDITEEFVGARDVDGLKHVHSHSALELMKTFVLAVLVDDSNKKLSFLTGASSRAALSHSPQSGNTRASRLSIVKPTSYRGPSVFRRGRVVGMRYLTPDIEITHTSKPVILLQLALPKTRSDLQVQKLMSLPSCAFTFRAVDQNRVAVDRQYTPVKINNDYTLRRSYQGNKDDEEIFDFIISLVPGGKLSKILLDTRMGKMMLAQGPTVNQEIVQVFRTGGWKSVVLIAAGTGVSPMLQVIDFYLSRLSSEFRGVESKLDSDCPDLYLMWIVKGPKYNYSDALALDTRVERSQGKFKYTVIYSSSQGKREEETVQKPKHGWTFKQIVDKTVPSREVLTGRLGFSAKLGLLKPKKVKHQVVDAAWKLKRGTSFRAERKGMSKRFNSASTRKRKDRLDAMNSMLDDIDEGDRNEITEETWLGDEVQANYRSYDKMLLEELLLSIPSDLVSRERKRASSEMPFIVEEEKSDSESDFLSGSDIPGDITLETETESSPATEAEEKEFEDGIPWLPQRKEDRSDTRPPSSPRSSWLSPVSARKHSEALVAKSLEEAQQNSSSIDDDQYESLDHKRLKRQNSPSRWGMAGGVIEPPKPELLPKPVSLQPPTRSPSSPPKLPSAAPVPPSNREKSDKPKTEKKEPVPTEKKKRPSLEDRTESKRPPQTPLGRISFLAKQGQRVEEDLNQFELAEQEYRDSKILVAISGAPMFEYKTRVILHEELAFPKEQMVTFHTSAQQI